MRPGYHEWQLQKAAVAATRSRDPSTKCGCVIVRPDKSTCSDGYNGFPRSMEDKLEWYQDRSEKYPRTIHAEMNALLHAKESVEGYTAYSTTPICDQCALHLSGAGIIRVVWKFQHTSYDVRWAKKIARALRTFDDCGVEVVILHEPVAAHVARENNLAADRHAHGYPV